MDYDELARAAADVAARRAVRETLVALGVDPDKPVEFQERMAFLKTCQTVVRTVFANVLTAVIGLIATGIVWAVWAQIGAPK